MRTCKKCDKTKADHRFSKSKSGKDGLSPWCKLCHKASAKAAQAKYYIGPKHAANNWVNVELQKRDFLIWQLQNRIENLEFANDQKARTTA